MGSDNAFAFPILYHIADFCRSHEKRFTPLEDIDNEVQINDNLHRYFSMA